MLSQCLFLVWSLCKLIHDRVEIFMLVRSLCWSLKCVTTQLFVCGAAAV